MEWVALITSAAALVTSVVAVLYARREARAAEEGNWLSHSLDFTVSVNNPDTGAARLVITYIAGLPLDEVALELAGDDDAPVGGFGVGRIESRSWTIGPMRVSDSVEQGLVQLLRTSGGGPPYRSGPFRIRAICRKGRQHREIALSGQIPAQPWVY